MARGLGGGHPGKMPPNLSGARLLGGPEEGQGVPMVITQELILRNHRLAASLGLNQDGEHLVLLQFDVPTGIGAATRYTVTLTSGEADSLEGVLSQLREVRDAPDTGPPPPEKPAEPSYG